jgi:hypothetical protein
MVNVLKAGMRGKMSGNHRGVILWRCRVHVLRSRGGLVVVVIIVAPAVEIVGAFVLVWRSKLNTRA